MVSQVKVHKAEVCGLKWSRRGNMLASGGNENHVYIWDSSKMSSSNFLHCFKDHRAAVKALAWCPYDSAVLASGGGTDDRSIKLWNVQKGTCICSIDTKAQARQTFFSLSWQLSYLSFSLLRTKNFHYQKELITIVLCALLSFGQIHMCSQLSE